MSAPSILTIESIEQKIVDSMQFQSMSVDGQTETNVSPFTLMKVRKELQAEQNRAKRSPFVTFDLSDQGFS